MAGLRPGHPRLSWRVATKDVDARHKAGHDELLSCLLAASNDAGGSTPETRHPRSREMVRIRTSLAIGPGRTDRQIARGIDPIQPHHRQSGGKRAQPRPDRANPRQHPPHRFHPEPVIEIAEHERSRRLHQAGQGMRLRVPFMDAQAEVGGNDPDLAVIRQDARGNGPARLPFLIGDVGNFRRLGKRPAARAAPVRNRRPW